MTKSTLPRSLIRLLVLALLVMPLWAPARAEKPSAPPNDDFDQATNITSDVTGTSLAALGATQAPDDPVSLCPINGTLANNWAASVWYKYTALIPGSMHVDSIGSNYDTVLSVWTGTRGNLNLISCNDDVVSGNLTTSSVDVPVQQGVTYYIEIAEFDFTAPPPEGLNLVLSFNFAGGIVSWERKADMPADRDLLGAAGGASNVFVIGGRACTAVCDQSPSHWMSYTVSAENARYTPATNTWSPVNPLPVPLFGHKAVYLDGKIYIPSGFTSLAEGSTADPTHRVYDPALNAWSTAAAAPWTHGVAGYYAVAVDAPHHEYYVLGGRINPHVTGGYLSDVYRYNTISNTWTALASMPVARYGFAADYIDGKIYAAAGTGAGGCRNDGSVYDVATNTWSAIANWAALLAPARCFPTSVVVAATGTVPYRWQIIGGSANAYGGESFSTALQYDPNSDAWMSMPGTYNSTVPRRAAAASSSSVGTFVFGGTSDYDNPDGDGITPRTEAFRPSSRYFIATVLKNAVFNFPDVTEPNNEFASAYVLANHASLPGYFPYEADLNDYYAISVTVPITVDIWVHDMPATENYSLFLYDSNRFRVAYSGNPGNADEHIQYYANLPGTYFIRVYNGRTQGLQGPAYHLTVDWP